MSGKCKLGAIAGVRVGKYNLGTKASKCKVSVWVSKHKLGTRAGRYKFGVRAVKYKLGARASKYKLGARARAGKYKLGARAGCQSEDRVPSKGPGAEKYKHLINRIGKSDKNHNNKENKGKYQSMNRSLKHLIEH